MDEYAKAMWQASAQASVIAASRRVRAYLWGRAWAPW